MRRRRVALLVLAVLAGASCSRMPADDAGVAFGRFDRARDGVITQAEFGASFHVFDLDGDGVIDARESAAIVYEADANRDGVVTPEEFATISLSRLEADLNRDGRITRAEFEAFDREVLARQRRHPEAFNTAADRRPETRWVQFRF
jgi:Ca2+-binding EF-hand superfamily protein